MVCENERKNKKHCQWRNNIYYVGKNNITNVTFVTVMQVFLHLTLKGTWSLRPGPAMLPSLLSLSSRNVTPHG